MEKKILKEVYHFLTKNSQDKTLNRNRAANIVCYFRFNHRMAVEILREMEKEGWLVQTPKDIVLKAYEEDMLGGYWK